MVLPEGSTNTDKALGYDKPSIVMNTSSVDEQAHTNDLDAKTDDLKKLVSMCDAVYDTSNDTA